MTQHTDINKDTLPKHVAIIMDGNGRWAKKQSKIRIFGHKVGVKAVRDTVEGAAELGLKYLTLYAFSSENWNRPKKEIDALMELLVNTILDETKTLMDNNIRLEAIGNLEDLPKKCLQNLNNTIEKTVNNTHMTLVLALSYSSKKEVTQAIKSIVKKVENGDLKSDEINEDLIQNHLYTHNIPDPELLIRTSGEQRISNFLLWQIAYSELYFTDILWPDFRREDLYKAIVNYQKRERRFGKTSEQIEKENA
ncbi:MAG: isoprenyl transferase [Flavobacteriales bacterium]|jgi:undecaprenyl diphosphate synthase|nr:isoprenyl transferase [Flavobacteriales bacterium]|tara:strand:+ start:16893 stop:17645 length:753 start_codon:yes stop_codon:yes gene_type:complete